MFERSTWVRVVIAGLLFMVLAPRPAHAYFERFLISARQLALGNALVAAVEDPSATVLNAAALTQLQWPGLIASYNQPFGVPDLEEHYLAFGMATKQIAFGASWHRFGLRDVQSEDYISLAAGRDLIRTSQDASLSIGAGIDVARVDVGDVYNTSQTSVSGNVSVFLRPFPVIGLAYVLRHIGEPSFDFVPGGGNTTLEMEHNLGGALYWRDAFVFLFEATRGQDSKWRQSAGLEVNAGDHLALRAGVAQGAVTGGVGIYVKGLTLDAATASHETLSQTYMLTLRYDFGRGATKRGLP